MLNVATNYGESANFSHSRLTSTYAVQSLYLEDSFDSIADELDEETANATYNYTAEANDLLPPSPHQNPAMFGSKVLTQYEFSENVSKNSQQLGKNPVRD